MAFPIKGKLSEWLTKAIIISHKAMHKVLEVELSSVVLFVLSKFHLSRNININEINDIAQKPDADLAYIIVPMVPI